MFILAVVVNSSDPKMSKKQIPKVKKKNFKKDVAFFSFSFIFKIIIIILYNIILPRITSSIPKSTIVLSV